MRAREAQPYPIAASGRSIPWGGAPESEIAAIETATAALNHPIVREAAEAEARGECRREEPITVPLDDGQSAEA